MQEFLNCFEEIIKNLKVIYIYIYIKKMSILNISINTLKIHQMTEKVDNNHKRRNN